MPTEFQNKKGNILHNVRNAFTFIDDFLIVTKGSKERHFEKVEEVLKNLEEAEIRLKKMFDCESWNRMARLQTNSKWSQIGR